jgi:hypothetical protein
MTTLRMLEDRICELVFCPWTELPDRLRKLGLQVEVCEEGESIIINNGYQTHGLTDIDPPTKAVMICAALSGSFRIGFYFPGLMPKIQKRWKQDTSCLKT